MLEQRNMIEWDGIEEEKSEGRGRNPSDFQNRLSSEKSEAVNLKTQNKEFNL